MKKFFQKILYNIQGKNIVGKDKNGNIYYTFIQDG